jgi:hypothetical protein
MKATAKINPDEYILSVLSPEDRLEAALNIARESFRKTALTIEDIEKAVKKVRSRAYEKGRR